MSIRRITLFNVDLKNSKFYKVVVDVSEAYFNVVDYQLRECGNKRNIFKEKIVGIDYQLLKLKALAKLNKIQELGII